MPFCFVTLWGHRQVLWSKQRFLLAYSGRVAVMVLWQCDCSGVSAQMPIMKLRVKTQPHS